ncbi:MAG: serine hydrolase [Gemmatimonadales bacterium]
MPRLAPTRFSLTTLAAVLGMAGTLEAQRHFPSDDAIQAILNEQVTAKKTTGLVLGILEADGTRRVFTAGKSGNPSVALNGKTVFEIGSITKVITTELLAEMVSRGEVALADPVQKYLPTGVTMPSRNGRQITLQDLATVNSGLPGMPGNFKPADMNNPYAGYTVKEMYDFLSSYTLPRDIGSQYEYSNLGMGLLGHVLGLRLGKGYFEAIDERILQPLGMGDTRIDLNPSMQSRLAPGHSPSGAAVPGWDLPTLEGAGALRSTVDDMLVFLAANANPASTPLGNVFTSTHKPLASTGSPAMSVGLGWHLLNRPTGPIVWHNGGTGGYRAFLGFDPAKKVGVVLLTNSSIIADDVGLHLIDPTFPLTKPPVARTAITIDPATLAKYTGTYQLLPEFIIVATVDQGALWLEPTGQPKFKVAASAEDEFFVNEADLVIQFQKDSTGAVTGFRLMQGGAVTPAKKVK